jgi:hypothetical protein
MQITAAKIRPRLSCFALALAKTREKKHSEDRCPLGFTNSAATEGRTGFRLPHDGPQRVSSWEMLNINIALSALI